MKHTERSMQAALTQKGALFSFLRYASVPNVSYGILVRGEADLLCLSKAGVFHEVEIKVTTGDLKRDRRKRFGHTDPIVKFTWFAVPELLVPVALEVLELRFGIVSVKYHETFRTETVVIRRPKRNLGWSRNPTIEQQIKFLRLGVMRMWSRYDRSTVEELETNA